MCESTIEIYIFVFHNVPYHFLKMKIDYPQIAFTISGSFKDPCSSFFEYFFLFQAHMPC